MGSEITKRPQNGAALTPGQTKRVLETLELVLAGKTWVEIRAGGGMAYMEFVHIMAKYPDVGKAYREARASSGQIFEDKALALADKLAGKNDYTAVGVRAAAVAMDQWRWSAARRNPVEFDPASSAKLQTVIPIQINTTLNLGQAGGEDAPKPAASVWEVHSSFLATATGATEAEAVEGEILPAEPETPPASVPVALDPKLEAIRQKVGLPEFVPSALPPRKSPGRPKKGHKGQPGTVFTENAYRAKKKSPAVRRALGITDEEYENEHSRFTGAGRSAGQSAAGVGPSTPSTADPEPAVGSGAELAPERKPD
jgi:hypothetical protein